GNKSVPAVVERAVADDDVFAFFDRDRGGVPRVFRRAVASGEDKRRAGAADVEVFDDDVRGCRVGGFVRAADFYNAPLAAPVIECRRRGRVASVDEREFAFFIRDAADDDWFFFGTARAEDEFFAV